MSLQLEHKSLPFLPLGKFIIRVLTHFLFSLILTTFFLGMGKLAYHYLGRLLLNDAFNNASMVFTGMGPINEMKYDGAKLFSPFYAQFNDTASLGVFSVMFVPIAQRLLHVLHIKEK